jgi:multiple sugar transport system substrate-binding protein
MSRLNRRSFIKLAGLSAATGVLSACALPPAPRVVERIVTPTPPPPAEGAKTILRVGTGDSGEGLTPHFQIIEKFEQANPDIQIHLEPVGSGDYYARILTQIAANDAPDILQIGDDAVPMFAGKGAFVDLDPLITGNDGLDTGIYLPGLVDPGKFDGKQFLLPKDYSPLAVYYNKKLFDAAGAPYPQAGWTWDDFLATAKALTKTEGGQTTQWGVQLPAAWTTGFEYWVAAAGGRLISEDGKSFESFMDSDAVKRAVQFYADLYNKEKVAPPPADMNSFGGGNSEFDSGTAAMRIFGRWPQSGMKKNPNIDLGVAGLPQDQARANVLFWGGFGIWSGTRHSEAAWRFLKFYVGEQGAEVWKDWALPSVASVAEASGQSTDPIEGVWLGELNHLSPRAYTFTPFWGETADPALRKVLETVIINPDADVAATLAEATKEAQAALNDKLK